MRARELAWAAGLFEGEGSVFACRAKQRRDGMWLLQPRASLSMTEEESVRRFAEVVGIGRVWPVVGQRGNKPQWRWEVAGRKGVLALQALLSTVLSDWKNARFEDALSKALGSRACA